MAWLIESVMNEEMKTAADFQKKKSEEIVKKVSDDIKAEDRNERLEKAAAKDRMSSNPKDLDRVISRQDAKVAVDKRDDLGYMSGNDAARSRAVDATARHNRRNNPNIE